MFKVFGNFMKDAVIRKLFAVKMVAVVGLVALLSGCTVTIDFMGASTGNENAAAEKLLKESTETISIENEVRSAASEVFTACVIAENDADASTTPTSVINEYNSKFSETSGIIVEVSGSGSTLTVTATHIESGITSTKSTT